jgi:hypothetical protein
MRTTFFLQDRIHFGFFHHLGGDSSAKTKKSETNPLITKNQKINISLEKKTVDDQHKKQ